MPRLGVELGPGPAQVQRVFCGGLTTVCAGLSHFCAQRCCLLRPCPWALCRESHRQAPAALGPSSGVQENTMCVAARPKGEPAALRFLTVTCTWPCRSGPLGTCRGVAKQGTVTLQAREEERRKSCWVGGDETHLPTERGGGGSERGGG